MGRACVWAAGLEGIEAFPVEVEVEIIKTSSPGMRVVGLPDAALREACDRVRAALRAESYKVDGQSRITVNLAPARRRKEEGAAFDLPAALAILAASTASELEPRRLRGIGALGELALDGRTRPVRGALAAAETLAAAGITRLLVPPGNARAAALGAGDRIEVIPVVSLGQAVAVLNSAAAIAPVVVDPRDVLSAPAAEDLLDLIDVRGAEAAKRALVVAACGSHDLLMVGPPGAGKTMLARRLPGLLPPLEPHEMLEVTRIQGVVATTDGDDMVVRRRPFRAPHHTASYAALVGGGSTPRPGEVTRAHHGVLFLDEMPEFSTRTLQALREPLECRTVTIARAKQTLTLPANFQLVAAMNPCPCGYLGEPSRPCRCPPLAAERYEARISGPLLDRIDLQSRLRAVPVELLQTPLPSAEDAGPFGTTAAARAVVLSARGVQAERGEGPNARLGPRALRRVLNLSPAARRSLSSAGRAHRLTARGLNKVQKVSRTLADMEGRATVSSDDVALAVHLRVGERATA